MNVRSERMSASARFTDTAQLGRLCKNCVRRRFRGVRGGSLSKKLRLNQPYTCVRKVSARFPCPWPHFRGSRRPVLRPWRRRRPVCTLAAGYPAPLRSWSRSINAWVFAHCAAHSGVAVWQLQQSIPVVRAWRESRGSVSALDCRTDRQRRLTSSFRLDSPARDLPALFPGLRRGRLCTAALLPRHRLPVASSLAQPHIASSALKSGL